VTDALKRLVGPVALSSSPLGTPGYYKVGAGKVGTMRSLRAVNGTNFSIYFTLSIGVDAVGTRLWDYVEIPAKSSLEWTGNEVLAAGEFIDAWATSSSLVLTISGVESDSVAAGGETIKTMVFTVAYADLVSENNGGLLLDNEGDAASVGRKYLPNTIPAGAILIGVKTKVLTGWAYGGPPPDAAPTVVIDIGTKTSFLNFLSVSTAENLGGYSLSGVSGAAPLGIQTVVSTLGGGFIIPVAGEAELAVMVEEIAVIGGNDRVLFADIIGGSVEFTIFYYETL